MASRRLLLVQSTVPPYPGGTNTVIERLLRDLPGWEADAVTDRAMRRHQRGAAAPFAARAHVLKLPPWRAIAPLAHALNAALAVVAGARAALFARRRGAGAILTTFDGGFSQIAATVAARLTGLPLVVFVFDLWEENAYSGVERATARLLESRILCKAAAVVVFCEAAAEHYRVKHGISADVLQIPLARDSTPDPDPPRPLGAAEEVEVFVAGALYWAQEDAVRRLAAAVHAAPELRLTVVGDRGELERRGLHADRVEERLAGGAFQERLERADTIALGLSLHSPHPDIVRTATPARLVDYMASGRPLLVHAPGDSHVARYARAEDFAEVVDADDVDEVTAGLRRLVADPARAAERGVRARALAAERHDCRVVQQGLAAILARVTGAAGS
ncbi:MAG: glycosyltransferase family 4 protein [Solirubrobacterales bacterium]|nr:glycosyltransferase family 4 protein [Solirubrobacterales bacterium]